MRATAAILDTLTDGRRIAALVRDGALADLLVDPPEAWGPVQPGSIFRGKLDRPLKGQGGAIVLLGDERKGFLRETKGLAQGQMLTVQVTGVAERGKAPPVTTRVLFRSRFAIATPGRPGISLARQIRDDARRSALAGIAQAAVADLGDRMGLILRSAAETATDDDIAEDITETSALAAQIAADDATAPGLLLDAADAHLAAWRDWPTTTLADEVTFDRAGTWDLIAPALSPRQPLPGGGHMFIEPTRALTAVDVNTGGDTSPGAGLKANVAALRALPAALTLRGLGGQITVDPAPFGKRDRQQLEQVLHAAMRADAGEISLAGWTPLGHLELQRKRDRHPITELLKDALPDL